jgi:hypothetical protein
MSRAVFHTITIHIPHELVFVDKKTGKLKIVPTLTKAGGLTKKAGESAIILKSDDYIVHPKVDHGKTMTQQEMRRSGYTDKIAEKANKQKAKKDEYKLDIKIENEKLSSPNPDHQAFIEQFKTLKKYMFNFTPTRFVKALEDLYKVTKKGTKELTHKELANWIGKHNIDGVKLQKDLGI